MSRSASRAPRLGISAFLITRSGGDALDAAAVQQRSRAFGASVTRLRSVSLLAVRDDSGLSTLMLTPDSSSDAKAAAAALAHSVSATSTPAPEVPDLSCEYVGVVTARPAIAAGRETTAGADPAEVARTIERASVPGSWVAVTLRAPNKSELRRTRRWFDHREIPGTHYSREGEVMVATIRAGGPDANTVRDLLSQVVAVLPGFDVESEVRILSSAAALVGTGLGAAALWTLLVPFRSPMDGLLASLGASADVTEALVKVGLGLAGALALVTLGLVLGIVPTAAGRARAKLAEGIVPAPRVDHGVSKRAPRRESKKADGTLVAAHPGDYPLVRDAFLVGPSVVVGIAAPYGGGSAGAAVTRGRDASPLMLDDIGPMIGAAPSNRGVHISAADLASSAFIVGIPDAGKSIALRAVFGWHCAERVSPKGLPGFPGRSSALIAFESKGEGAAMYSRWASGLGDDPVRIDLADPATAAIDFFDSPGTTRERALLFVNAMKYAYPEGSIMEQSVKTLVSVIDAGQNVTDAIAAAAKIRRGSVVEYADILIGNQGDERGCALAVALAEAAQADPDDEQLVEAVTRLGPLYGGTGQTKVTPAQRRALQSAPSSKIEPLIEERSWWSPDRARVGWATLLSDFECVIINTGVSDSGRLVSDHLTQLMSSMLMFTLRETVMRTCSSWKDMGRSVTVFADELALLSGGSGDVISWFRNQGRSYGVRQVLATQFPDQLATEVRASVLGFGVLYWFTQNSGSIAQLAVEDLTADGSEWTRADITGLPKHTAVVRATVDKQRQPATTVRIGFWEDEGGLPRFCAEQGYPDSTVLAHPASTRPWMLRGAGPAVLDRSFDPAADMVDDPSAAVDPDVRDDGSDVATPDPASARRELDAPGALDERDEFDPRRFDRRGRS